MSGNLLGQSTSPYLLQHKDNPVHWRPWGQQAFADAKAGDRPILLSVGYAACHWCHVMAHESFENPDIAGLMNELFVNVKVDREERPDVDTIYMAALHMLGEQGGWPMTMFLTPDGEPFWGGTYFPPEPRWGRPSFPAVLREIARLYGENRTIIDTNVAALRPRLAALAEPAPDTRLSTTDADAAADALLGAMDPVQGGLRGAPKFPNCGVLELLLRSGLRRGDTRHTDAVTLALEKVCEGGIYDHLGGGFARYSVDSRWLVPHFEKMLYDNAQLIDLLTSLWQLTRRPLFAARVAETIAWAAREMRLHGGGFASSLDADSEGEEGRFYVWDRSAIESILGPSDFKSFAEAYDVTGEGNWEGRTILNRLKAERFSIADDEHLAPLRAKLLVSRAGRIQPSQDDKILADWNGLMIAAIARASATFNRPDWLVLAEAAFRFVTESMSAGDLLFHSSRAGAKSVPGLVGDYANMALAATTLCQVTADRGTLGHAAAWLAVLDDHFVSDSGAYHMSHGSASDLIVRPLSGADDATPNANAIAAEALMQMHCFTGNIAFAERADKILTAFAGAARREAFGHARLLAAADSAAMAMEIVVTGDGPPADALWRAAWRTAAPASVRAHIRGGTNLRPNHPVAFDVNAHATAHVCSRQTCSLPITNSAALTAEIETRRHP